MNKGLPLRRYPKAAAWDQVWHARELVQSAGGGIRSPRGMLGSLHWVHPPPLAGPHLPEELDSGPFAWAEERAGWKFQLPLVSLYDLPRWEAMAA
jgi:hypothetical protein